MSNRSTVPTKLFLAFIIACAVTLGCTGDAAMQASTRSAAPAAVATSGDAHVDSSAGDVAIDDTTHHHHHKRRASTDTTSDSTHKAPVLEWPVTFPTPLPGSILPGHRIVAFYGNPLSKKMGVLGELPTDAMLAKLDKEVAAWNAADSTTPVQPALHMIVSVAQGAPGKDGMYRQRSDPALIEKVYAWAKSKGALLFLDVQVGHSTLRNELPILEPFLSRPDVHLGIDPEFAMHGASEGKVPGTKIGTFDASDVNYASTYLASLVDKYHLPPKVLIVHRFTRDMLTNYRNIHLDPRVQIVVNMDGWGPPSLKRDTYKRYVYRYPVEFTGFKLFFHNDTKTGTSLMTPRDVLALYPKPVYIQYQ